MAGFSGETAAKVKSDFDAIWTTDAIQRLEAPTRQRDLFRSVHKFAVCMSFLANAIKGVEEHKRIFFQEASSDTLHLLHVLLSGDARGGKFYLRSIIENFMRHEYFAEHRVEYGWLRTRSGYYVTLAELRKYCAALDAFSGKVKVCLNSLEREYGELSTEVHSTSADTLVLRESMTQIVLTEDQTRVLGRKIRNVLKDILVLSIVSNRDVFDGLHVNTQAFILSCLDAGRLARRQEDLTPAPARPRAPRKMAAA